MKKSPFKITLKGQKVMSHKLAKVAKEFPKKAASAVLLEGEFVMGRSKKEFVPVKDSILKNTGHVVSKGLTAELVYGGPAAAHALAVHEHLSQHSPRSWKAAEKAGNPVRFTTGGPKYLEKPLMEWMPKGPKRLAKRLNIEKMV